MSQSSLFVAGVGLKGGNHKIRWFMMFTIKVARFWTILNAYINIKAENPWKAMVYIHDLHWWQASTSIWVFKAPAAMCKALAGKLQEVPHTKSRQDRRHSLVETTIPHSFKGTSPGNHVFSVTMCKIFSSSLGRWISTYFNINFLDFGWNQRNQLQISKQNPHQLH